VAASFLDCICSVLGAAVAAAAAATVCQVLIFFIVF